MQTWLAADDDEQDQFFLKRAFEKANIPVKLNIVSDGQEAIDYLNGTGDYADRKSYPLPQLLLLDLKMPKIDGFEVLRWVQQQKSLNRLPVIVLSSSQLPPDINRAYELGANSYIVKPMKNDDLISVAKTLKDYWLNVNQLPTCKSE